MLKIKADRMKDLEKFGFQDWGTYYALDPNFYKTGPLKGLFTYRNVFVDKQTGRFWCGFLDDEAKQSLEVLNKADMVEEV